MGALDCVASVMQLFAVNYITNASMIVLLQQSSIPISMAISYLLLGARCVHRGVAWRASRVPRVSRAARRVSRLVS